MMAVPRKSIREPRFEVGAQVRVKPGVTAPDYHDIPLGGWAGTVGEGISSVDWVKYEIEWNRRTLDAMPPVYRKRCERDDLDIELMWLQEEDLEPDDGTPVPIEQPTKLRTPPLSDRNQDDRVRKALGLTHDDPLPEISYESLLAYYHYLTTRLKFPFSAYAETGDIGPFTHKRTTVTVTGLVEPVPRNTWIEEGLVCICLDEDDDFEIPLAELILKKKEPNHRLISDYAYWLDNWPIQDENALASEVSEFLTTSKFAPPSLGQCIVMILSIGFVGAVLGASIGASFNTMSGAAPAALTGGILLAIVGAVLAGWIAGVVNPAPTGGCFEAVLGTAVGALVGVISGLSIMSLPWSLLGLIVGTLLGRNVPRRFSRRSFSLWGAFYGICGGLLIAAFRHDRALTKSGATSGALIGSLIAAGMVVSLLMLTFLMLRVSERDDRTTEELGEDMKDGEDDSGPRLMRS